MYLLKIQLCEVPYSLHRENYGYKSVAISSRHKPYTSMNRNSKDFVGEVDRIILSSFGKIKPREEARKLCIRIVKEDVGEGKAFLGPLRVPG